jgi:hypothetical protein
MEGMERVLDADEGMEPFEDFVDSAIAAPTVPPSLDHSFVVSVYGKVPANCASVTEVADKTLEANSFGPTDVPLTIEGLPSGDEPPSSPSALDSDGDPNARACIRERPKIV